MATTIGEIHDRETEMSDPDASSAKRAWRVVTDDRSIREAAIYSAGSLYFPQRFDPHPDNLFLTCRRLSIENQSDSPLHWIVTADYSSAPIDKKEKDRQQYPNPKDRPATIKWKSNRYRRAVSRFISSQIVSYSDNVLVDDFGESAVNAAGDPIDPPMEEDRSFWSIQVTKNVDSVPDWVLEIDNPVNQGSVTIGGKSFAEGTLKLIDISISEKKTEGIYDYYEVGLEIEYRKDGHYTTAQNQGFREKSGTQRRNILDEFGQPISSPWPLDENGAKISNPTPDDATFIKARLFGWLDFSQLPLT